MLCEENPKVKSSKEQITKLDLEIRTLVQDIEKCRGPLSILDHLNSSAESKLQDLKNMITDFKLLEREQSHESSKRLISKAYKEYMNQYLNIRTKMRKANLTCQLAIEKDCKQSLFDRSSAKSSDKVDKDVNKAMTLTHNMTSLTQMMAEQVKHIESTNSTLITSSGQLNSAHEELKSISGHVQISQKLVTKYDRRIATDKVLLLITLVFFFASVFYIIKKRLGITNMVNWLFDWSFYCLFTWWSN